MRYMGYKPDVNLIGVYILEIVCITMGLDLAHIHLMYVKITICWDTLET